MRSCWDALRLTKSLDNEPILVLKLIKIAVGGMTINAMKETMHVTDASPDTYRQVLCEFDDMES